MKHVHAELIKAWADGAEIEYHRGDVEWVVTDEPAWSPYTDYRIKPTPKPDEVRYGIAVIKGGYSDVRFLGPNNLHEDNNLKLTFDGETSKLKAAEVL